MILLFLILYFYTTKIRRRLLGNLQTNSLTRLIIGGGQSAHNPFTLSTWFTGQPRTEPTGTAPVKVTGGPDTGTTPFTTAVFITVGATPNAALVPKVAGKNPFRNRKSLVRKKVPPTPNRLSNLPNPVPTTTLLTLLMVVLRLLIAVGANVVRNWVARGTSCEMWALFSTF
jgi:hypothetical protein